MFQISIRILGYIVFHLFCGIIATGLLFAIAQRKYPSIAAEDYAKDLRWSYTSGMSYGPVGLGIILLDDGLTYGFKWR